MTHIDLNNKTIFVTGSAGFIGSNLIMELLRSFSSITGIGFDNINYYYDVSIKEWRLAEIDKCIKEYPNSKYIFIKDDLANSGIINQIFDEYKPDVVVNLATQAGADGLPLPPYAVYNIGNSNPENLLDFVQILQEELVLAGVLPVDYDFDAHKELVPMQPGDVPITFADTSALENDYGFSPNTSLRE